MPITHAQKKTIDFSSSMKVLFIVLLWTSVRGFCPAPATTTQLRASPVKLHQRLQADKEWVEQDMKDAGKADHESDDWVADDMENLGSQVGEDMFDKVGWVAKDMLKAGQGALHPAHKRKVEDENDSKNKKNWDIAKDMKRTGKSTDWIARDMEEAGSPDSHNKFATEHFLNKLDQELNKQEKHRKDIQKDMEETGRKGSDASLEIQADMERTGKATNPLEALQDFFHSITYKLSEWTEKAFNVQEITKDMQEAGRTSDNSWLTHDMETTGKQGSDHANRLPTQNKDLQGDLSKSQHEDIIAKDMQREGKPDSTHTKRTEYKRNTLVYDDMKLAGSSGGSVSEERIRQDMESAGHAEGPYYNTRRGAESKTTQYQQEMEAFKSMPHAKPKAPVEPRPKLKKENPKATAPPTTPKQENVVVSSKEQENPQATVASSMEDAVSSKEEISFFTDEDDTLPVDGQDEPDEKPHEGFAKHLMKKVIHPRTPWKEL